MSIQIHPPGGHNKSRKALKIVNFGKISVKIHKLDPSANRLRMTGEYMALNVTELRNGTFFKEGKDILLVLTYEHVKTGRGSGNIKLKVRNVRTGSVIEKSFITGARVNEADVQKSKAQFLYQDGENFNFMDPVSFEQFSIPASVLGDQVKYLKEGLEVTLIVSGDEALGLELPMSLVYTISETGPGEKGNTVSNVFKEATLDNGLVIKVPMFIGVGDKVKVDTRSGEYIEREKG